jgi:hypothetical protein
MIGADVVGIEVGGASLKRDEVVGVASRSALRSSKPVLFGGCSVEVDGVFRSRDVVDNERREDVSPLSDVLTDMLGVVYSTSDIDSPSLLLTRKVVLGVPLSHGKIRKS